MFKQKSDSAPAKLEPADAVQQARTRARQRLIGAIVLLAIGIIGFPLVFETQPRPCGSNPGDTAERRHRGRADRQRDRVGRTRCIPAGRAGDGERARALLEARPVAAAEEARFVVQVGAFADAEAAREIRKQVEKLGLKTYTQVAQTPSGSRIRVRVGPFATRDEAEAALAKVKTAGLAAVLLTL